MVYAGKMDPECVDLCDALNLLPGIKTSESCCGHGEYPFRIWFLCESTQALRPLVESLPDCFPHWSVMAGWASGSCNVYFVLEGPRLRNAVGSDDVNQLAHFLGEQSTKQVPMKLVSNGSAKVTPAEISRVMAAMGRKGGKIGGVVRAARLTPAQRTKVALKAARARWDKQT